MSLAYSGSIACTAPVPRVARCQVNTNAKTHEARRLPHDAVEVEDGAALPTDVGAIVQLGQPGSGELSVVVSGGVTPPGSG